MALFPTPETVGAAAANLYDMVFGGGVADLRRTPAQILHEGPKCTVYRYLESEHHAPAAAPPVLLVPPLAAPTVCFDLRRDCSLAGHLIAEGRRTYLVEYGDIAFSDRELGLEFWIDEVIPSAVRRASADAGGASVQLVGWCLGGIMALLAAAADPTLPIAAIAVVASPFDFRRIPLLAALRPMTELADGFLGTALYTLLGGAPAPIVKRAFQLTSIDRSLTKPLVLATHLEDRDYLAQVEAVDRFMDGMHAYPGRTIGQLYHRFFRVNDLADGHLQIGDRQIRLEDVRVPVLAVAGESDVLAPRAAVHPVAELLTGAPTVRLETAPGGHLGVLAGRQASGTTWRYLDEFFADASAGAAAPRAA